MSLEKINENLGQAKLRSNSGAEKSTLARDNAQEIFDHVSQLMEALDRFLEDPALLPVDHSESIARRMAINTGISHRSYEQAVDALQAAAGETPSNDHLANALEVGRFCVTQTSFISSGSYEGGVPMRKIAEGLDEIQRGLEMAARAAGKVSVSLMHSLASLKTTPNVSNMVNDDITAYQNQAGLPTESYPTELSIREIPDELPPF